MLMQNISANTIRIPSNVTVGWRGKSDATVTVPPSGIVDVTNSYACRTRVVHTADSNPQIMPSIAERLSGGALKPYGRDANELYKLFADELPEVIAAQAVHRSGEMGVAASVDAKAEAARREAMDIGFKMMAVQGRLRAEEQPAMQPTVLKPEEVPPE